MTRIILVGGFLGAGKTTLLSRSAKLLTARGYRVGIITNDQGQNLVDTALLSQPDVTVHEIAGGCFCCRFSDLQSAIQQLEMTVKPDVILAEPVGSCTDLMATVIRPFLKFYGDQLTIAPLTILVDPTREIDSELEDIKYLYQQQMNEADIIAISKSDLLDDDVMAETCEQFSTKFPNSDIASVSAKSGEGLQLWLDQCLNQVSSASHVLDIDYAVYAAAEADLGWLNTQGTISTNKTFDPQVFLETVLQEINTVCQASNYFIAHVKSHAIHAGHAYKASLTDTGGDILWDVMPDVPHSRSGQFVINARVTTTPEELEYMVRSALQRAATVLQADVTIQALECFSPLPPEPMYHVALNDL